MKEVTDFDFAVEYAPLSPVDRLRMRKVLELLVRQQRDRMDQACLTAESENALAAARIERDGQARRYGRLVRQQREERRQVGLPVLW